MAIKTKRVRQIEAYARVPPSQCWSTICRARAYRSKQQRRPGFDRRTHQQPARGTARAHACTARTDKSSQPRRADHEQYDRRHGRTHWSDVPGFGIHACMKIDSSWKLRYVSTLILIWNLQYYSSIIQETIHLLRRRNARSDVHQEIGSHLSNKIDR
jgi:hypothetical protein